MNFLDDGLNGGVDAALQCHRVRTRGDRADAFFEDRLCENRSGRCAVTGNIRGLRSDFADHLRAHILERVLQFDLLRDRHTVFGDRRGTELLVDNDVAAFRAERNFDRVCELVYSAQNSGT